MTDALVEAVARALCRSDEQNGGAPWDWYGSDKARSGYFDASRAALQAIEAAGYRVVPVEATDRMSEACWRKASDVGNGKLGADQDMWSAMLSAAPRVGEG